MRYLWKFSSSQLDKMSPAYVALCRAFSLLDKINEQKTEKKASFEGPEKLLSIMDGLVRGCIKKVSTLRNKLREQGITPLERRSLKNTVRSVVLAVNMLHAFLRYVDATRVRRNPSGMIKPWELLIKKHNLGKDLNIIIRPQWKYNYSYYNMIHPLKMINDFVGEQETAASQLDKAGPHFPILSFAGLERDNILLHVILAHEIGHFIAEREGFATIERHGPDIRSKLNEESVFTQLQRYYELSYKIKREEDELQGVPANPSYHLFIKHEVYSQAQIELIVKIKRWLEEITADIIAVRIVGPAFIFALYQTEGAQAPKMGPVGDYPPPQVRIEKCVEAWDALDRDEKFFEPKKTDKAEHQKIKKCIGKYLANIKSTDNDVSLEPSSIGKLKTERYRLLNEILKQVVENPLNDIKKSIKEKVTPYRLDDGIFELIELLKDRITPIWQPQPTTASAYECDIPTILNAGWIFWLTHELTAAEKEETNSKIAELDITRRLCYEPLVEISNLILKGIELDDFGKQFVLRIRQANSQPSQQK